MASLKEEIEVIKSLFISLVGKDKEGDDYLAEFVKEILKAAKEKPRYSFKGPKNFLKQIQSETSQRDLSLSFSGQFAFPKG